MKRRKKRGGVLLAKVEKRRRKARLSMAMFNDFKSSVANANQAIFDMLSKQSADIRVLLMERRGEAGPEKALNDLQTKVVNLQQLVESHERRMLRLAEEQNRVRVLEKNGDVAALQRALTGHLIDHALHSAKFTTDEQAQKFIESQKRPDTPAELCLRSGHVFLPGSSTGGNLCSRCGAPLVSESTIRSE